jgi:hypothetical protein
MQNDYYYAKHHRGSSPPFQKSQRGFDDWVRSLRSIDQHPYDMTDIQMLEQQRDLNKIAIQESRTKQ